MSATCLRRFLNLFLVIYRDIDLQQRKQFVSTNDSPKDSKIRKHHIYAGIDDFHQISMHYDLIIGARLIYMHDFSGMYNCVTQVVYFHNPDYIRRSTLLEPIDDIAKGSAQNDNDGCQSLYTIPSLLQLYPEITLLYDDCGNLFDGNWHWLLFSKKMYLIDKHGNVFYDSNIIHLINMYLNDK